MVRREARTYRATVWARMVGLIKQIVPEMLGGLGLLAGLMLLPIFAGVFGG